MIARSWCEASEAQQLCGHACYAGDVNKHPAKIAQYVYWLYVCMCVCACTQRCDGEADDLHTYGGTARRTAAIKTSDKFK